MSIPLKPVLAGLLVASSMLALFLVPKGSFVPLTFVATSCMCAVALLQGRLRWSRPRAVAIATGSVSALVLYGLFVGGAAFVASFRPFGISPEGERTLYSLIANPSNPLVIQVLVLLADATGYEAYFRGTLQRWAQLRLGVAAVPAVALADAGLHLAAFVRYPDAALLWFGTTFLADIVWGLALYRTGSLWASFASHLIWDFGIFLVAPVR